MLDQGCSRLHEPRGQHGTSGSFEKDLVLADASGAPPMHSLPSYVHGLPSRIVTRGQRRSSEVARESAAEEDVTAETKNHLLIGLDDREDRRGLQ